MTDYGSHLVANAAIPLPSALTNSLLKDADPVLFYALDFWASILNNYLSARLVAQASAAGMSTNPDANGSISAAVAQQYPYNPEPYLTEAQFGFPLLAAFRKNADSSQRKTAVYDHDVSNLTIAYILPPLTAAQAEQLIPILSAVYKTLRACTDQGWDPSYTPPGGVAGDSPMQAQYGNAERWGILRGEWGSMPASGNLFFPAVLIEAFITERDNYVPAAQKFDGADIEVDLVAGDGTTFPNIVDASVQGAPTITSLSVTSGSMTGGTVVTLTGTLFLSGPPLIHFGPNLATNVVWHSATSVTCTTPAVSGPGTVSVTITNRDGQSGSLAAAYQFVPQQFDWMGIVGQGQSLSVGYDPNGSVVLSTTQPYNNLKLTDTGPNPKFPIAGGIGGSPGWAAVPLVEPFRPYVAGSGAGYSTDEYPNNLPGIASGDAASETPHPGMANTLSQIWATRYGSSAPSFVTAHTIAGTSGQALTGINKEGSGRAYPASINEVSVWASLAVAAGKTFGVRAVVLTHGEADVSNAGYGAGLVQFITDYNTDIKASTGQTASVILFASQQSSEVTGGQDSSSVQLWQEAVAHPTLIVCTGPKYQFQYAQDNLHLLAACYQRLGQKYAEVFDIVVNQGKAWAPLQPTAVSRSGATITVTFNVPNAPMVFDAHVPAPHENAGVAGSNIVWANGLGFEVLDSTGAKLTISSATIVGNAVQILLSAIPTNLPLVVQYAITSDAGSGANGGSPYGCIGTLRDSDPFVGVDAETIEINVINGSASVTPVTTGGFARRTIYDVVTGASFAAGTVVTAADNNNAPATLTLSHPWTGTSGIAAASFHHDESNFCVHFTWPGVT